MNQPDRIFHIFTDGKDEYTEDWFEALGFVGRWLKAGFANIRLYVVDGFHSEETEVENCLISIGAYPA